MIGRIPWRRGLDVVAMALRVWLGWQWFQAGFEKVGNAVWTGDKAGAAVTGFLKGALAKTAGQHPDVQPFYAHFIQQVALPHAKWFSYGVAYGELLVGIGLMLGALTTVALVGGMLMNFNYMLAGTVSVNPVWLAAALVLLFMGNGGRLGADGAWTYIRRLWGSADPSGGGGVATDGGRQAA